MAVMLESQTVERSFSQGCFAQKFCALVGISLANVTALRIKHRFPNRRRKYKKKMDRRLFVLPSNAMGLLLKASFGIFCNRITITPVKEDGIQMVCERALRERTLAQSSKKLFSKCLTSNMPCASVGYQTETTSSSQNTVCREQQVCTNRSVWKQWS